ncbi:MAG TPA: helix-turn-helix domain-containing protein [Asanoa sp.]|nr:helix-turn-helix domain-containing protein [Asanoa sp.]
MRSPGSVRTAPGPGAHWNNEDADFIREVLDLVGDKWSVLIIGTLADGPVRYSDLSDAIPGISQRMLTLTLKHLQRTGLVTRTSYPEVPPRVEYARTELGTSLLSTVTVRRPPRRNPSPPDGVRQRHRAVGGQRR